METAHAIVDIIASRMGSDILLLDISAVTLIADYFIIATGESDRQLRAMLDAVTEELKAQSGLVPVSRPEGTTSSGWLLLDYGNIVVHFFSPSQRSRYQLEELWNQARVVMRMA